MTLPPGFLIPSPLSGGALSGGFSFRVHALALPPPPHPATERHRHPCAHAHTPPPPSPVQAVVGNLIMLIAPGVCYAKLTWKDEPRPQLTYAAVAMAIFGTVMVPIGIAVSFIK